MTENSELAARGLPDPRERALLEPYRGRVPEEVFTQEYQPPATDGSGSARANLRKAVELSREAGWEIRDGKLTERATGEIAVELLADVGGEAAEMIRAESAALEAWFGDTRVKPRFRSPLEKRLSA